MTSDKAQSMVILAGAGIALYLGWKAYRAGSAAVGGISDAVQSVADTVAGAVHQVGGAARSAYAEVATVVTGRQHYSPDALNGSMSRADAERLAQELEALAELEQSAEYDAMIRNELDRLGTNHPPSGMTDPSLPYFGGVKP